MRDSIRDARLTRSNDLGVAPRDCLDAALAAPQSIAPMPRVCAQLAELAAQEFVDGAQYARLMQSDPVLAGEVMRVANSPALRPRSNVVSLQQAVSWLGIAEVRNIAMAIMLRGEVFTAPGHEPESEEFWREAWFAGLWAKEIARLRRRHVENAFLAALMHRTGAALALKILSRFEVEQRTAIDTRTLSDLVTEFDPQFARVLMQGWRIAPEIQSGATDWRDYAQSTQSDLAATVHAAHVLAAHTLHPQLLVEEVVLESPVFEHLGVFLDQRKALVAMRDTIRATSVG
jgi:HD-like signal output (HDOD) protein